jgi:peptidoglycan/LPS O-acetylase OafA/YrhL
MQYFLRFYLSCTVVMSHLWANAFGGSGSYAVCGFYVISGYVITMVLQKRYLVIEHGLKKFWINRFLRLYPAFLVVTFYGYVIVHLAPLQADALGVGLVLPESDLGRSAIEQSGFPGSWWPWFYFPNLTMLGIQAPVFWTTPIAFAPTAWSTNVELFYYAILSLGAAASAASARKFLNAALAMLAILPVLYMLHTIGRFPYGVWCPGVTVNAFLLFYKTFLGWTYFFALGCMAYFVPKLELTWTTRCAVLAIFLVFPFVYAKNVFAMILLRIGFGFWVALTILTFSDDKGPRFAQMLGDLSYPMFLMHWPVAALVSWLTGLPKNGPLFLVLSLALSLAFSAAIVLRKPPARTALRSCDELV